MNQIIEVKIKKLKVNYEATCDLFPTCKGIGKSKDEAMKNLSKSISSFISKMVKGTLDTMFESNNYTQIMVDQTTEPYEETMGFNFSSKIPMVPKNILFKVPTITEEIDDVDLDQKEDDILPYEQFFLNQNKQDDTVLENDLFDQVAFHPKSNQDHESIVFGFPLNFN